MRIVAVMGSPAKNGNTCRLAREVLKGARDSGAEIEEIFLAEKNIDYCKGCVGKINNMCMSTGKCRIEDEVEELKKKLYEADGIVFASPSYGMLPTARMKNFLIDRIGMFTAYTSALGGKYFVGVSTCGGIGANKVAKDMAKHFVTGFHCRGYMSGYLGVKLGYEKIDSRPDVMSKAYQLGGRLADDIVKKRKYPFQSLKDRMITALIVRKLILKNIYANKDGQMKAVYENLLNRGLIKPIGIE